MSENGDAMEMNHRHWDELVPIHVASQYYDVAGFKAGKSRLLQVELDEVGDVRGKTLLHLQCHFGMDTLSWAREGAIVTGVDFSQPAIDAARALAAETGIEARFIESNVYELRGKLEEQFDIVFTSIGVLCWLPDVPQWARIAANYVKPGGVFYIMDGHPVAHSLDDEAPVGEIRLQYPYFNAVPVQFDGDGSYADTSAKLTHHSTIEFNHNLGEVVTSLIDAGLQIEFLHEFPFSGWQALPGMAQADDGLFYPPAGKEIVPFLYSIRARKPA